MRIARLNLCHRFMASQTRGGADVQSVRKAEFNGASTETVGGTRGIVTLPFGSMLFPIGHLGADLFVDRFVLFKDIALDTVSRGLGCREFLKTGNVFFVRRGTLRLLQLLGRPLAIRRS
jgi:hypothetical protein